MQNQYPKRPLNLYRKYERENNTTYRIWFIPLRGSTDEPRWVTCYGLFRGLPIIPNRSMPNYDCRKPHKWKQNDDD